MSENSQPVSAFKKKTAKKSPGAGLIVVGILGLVACAAACLAVMSNMSVQP